MGLIGTLLGSKWFWIIVVLVSLVLIVPFTCILIVLSLPDPIWRALATVIIIACWGIAAGYTDWVLAKNKERRRKFP